MNRCWVYGNNISGCSVFGEGRKKQAGEVCSVFGIGDFCQVFNQVIYFEINR